MAFLYEQMDTLRSAGFIKEVPKCITSNLNAAFELRSYQRDAFENFITYYENLNLRQKPTQTLFHMATGSGKTLIMAGLMLYLYKQGYRDFMFFVNLTNIVRKTKDNFLSAASAKYLFNERITIDGEDILIREVDNFQFSNPNAINIVFSTTQGLHTEMNAPKENSISFDDFKDRSIVLISDESHHINASTKRLSKEEEVEHSCWETTVKQIVESNIENILLEFTATCDLGNIEIKEKYNDRIIFDYPLVKFRNDGYSKEIKTLRSDISVMDRMLQACMLSQYRLKVFQDYRLLIKPVIMFKAKRSTTDTKSVDKTADEWMDEFIQTVELLDGATLARIAEASTSQIMNTAYRYFSANNITFDMIAQELKDDFSAERCISANNDKQVEQNQLILNSLENQSNPYRAVFAVNKLDEGWDVLNLFDIVRLYETRQSGGKKISQTTISEAQLIGRGARYCPFQVDENQVKHQRKFDNDLDAPLRICEELYYHCQNDSRYIGELYNALREIGLDLDKTKTQWYTLKPSFKDDTLYREGLVFSNSRYKVDRDDVDQVPASIREEVYRVRLVTGLGGEDVILDGGNLGDRGANLHTTATTLGDIARKNYAFVHKALRKYDIYRFDSLKSRFPYLSSVREFILDDRYLNSVKVFITSRYSERELPPTVLHDACVLVLDTISDALEKIEDVYKGSFEFSAKQFRDIFSDKSVLFTNPTEEGRGISQGDSLTPTEYRLDLANEDWYVFNDNYGTSEEKQFVAHFKIYVDQLRGEYDKCFLVRNERQLAIYSFESGDRFEPDYLLFLQKNDSTGYEQYQVFVEPKGNHLLAEDKWKEDFLLEIEDCGVPVKTFADDNKYHIWGLPFFNKDNRMHEFMSAFGEILPSKQKESPQGRPPDYFDQRFELWLQNQGIAARGVVNRQTLREIFDALDDDDK